MEEYMKILLEQIRCKKAHPYIKEEIKGHIEEQIVENMRQGMPKENAEKAAVEDMGSPVEVGISLDRIHKPQVAWRIIGLMAVISLAGIILQQIIRYQTGIQEIGSLNYAINTIIGFGIMLIVYRIDYSVIARYSKIIAILLLGICVLAFVYGGREINGALYYIEIGFIQIALFSILILYVPMYGAVIYKYHGLGYKAFIKSILWMLLPVFIASRLPNLSLALILLVSMSVVLTVAVTQGWFKVSKKKVIIGLWTCIFGVPVMFLMLSWKFGLLAPYQMERIKGFLTGDANYVTSMLRANLQESQLIGSNGKIWTDYLINSDSYLLTYVSSAYGLLLGAIICCALAVLIIEIFSISFRQKNQLGRCMGCGCGMVLLLNVILNIGINSGWLPLTQSFLPFFSGGENNVIVCYILVGIILSIYRYKNIYPANISTKLKNVKMTIQL